MEEDKETCKVVLVGEQAVGKTSIIKQFLEQSFVNNCESTVGANYSSAIINVNGEKKKFTIWDTAGQERYRALIKMFYKDAMAAVLVYDITVQRTFTELQKYWHKELVDNCSSSLILAIAANKSDLYEKEKVDEMEAREFAKDIGALFVKTSALNSTGIDNLFIEIGERFISSSEGKEPRKESISIRKKDIDENEKNQKGKKKTKCCQ